MKKGLKVPERVKFSTKNLTSVSNRSERIKKHFILLRRFEILIINNPDIAHKCLYVELDDKSTYLMDVSALYINCTLWLFNTAFNEPITKDDIHDMSDGRKGTYLSIMDKIISKFLKLGHNLDDFNLIGVVKEKIIRIARFYGEIYANTFSLYDIMAFESRSPEFSELYNTVLDPEMSSHESETFLIHARKRLYDIVIEDKQTSLYPFLSTGMVKELQIGQMFVAVGARLDIDKSVLPVKISRGWMHGMETNSEFYVEAVSNRNSIIVKKEAVPDSGYLSRKVNIACLNTHTDSNVYDCGTQHYLSYFVQNEAHLKLIEGKYMLVDSKGPILKEISTDDTDLIGRNIQLRSHTKCITGHKMNKVCSICLGNKHTTLKNARIGGLVGIKLINPITQLGMSAKHASSTKSEEIGGDVLNRYFTVSKTNIYPKKEAIGQLLIPLDVVNDILSSDCIIENSDIEQGLDFSKTIDMILIAENGAVRGVDMEDKNFFVNISDSLVNIIKNHSSDIVRIDDVVQTSIEIESENDTNWIDEFQDIEFLAIDFIDLDSMEPVFYTKLLSEEVSKYLKITKSIIDGCKTSTYNKAEEIIIDLVDVLFKAGLKTKGMMIHIETLVMNLIRSAENTIERADYSNKIEPEIQIVKLSKAIQKSDLFSGLCFEDQRRQFELADLLKKRSPGIFDIFFKNTEFLKNGETFRKTRKYLFKR